VRKAVGLLIGIIALAGCGHSNRTTTVTTSTTLFVPSVDQTTAFQNEITSGLAKTIAPASALAAGTVACTDFRNGSTAAVANSDAYTIIGHFQDPASFEELMYAATTYLCPKYQQAYLKFANITPHGTSTTS
jgi:hypothetical protein